LYLLFRRVPILQQLGESLTTSHIQINENFAWRVPGLEGHISYSCTPNLWVSLDTNYSFRGDTIVNGTDQNDAQQNFILGSEANVSINPRNLLVFKFAWALVYKNGPSYTGFSLEYIFSWGKGYK
jgi:hypothetical protein